MADKSKIEWTEATWNPILGCDKISPGCKNCYAIRTAHRLQYNPNPKVAKAFEGLTVIEGGKPNWTGRVNFVEERLFEPLHWKQPRRIFVNSQSDLFHEDVTEHQIGQILTVMAMCPQHTFQVLTKRPERMQEFFSGFKSQQQAAEILSKLRGSDDIPLWDEETECVIHNMISGANGADGVGWPLKNLWLGVSCESPKYKNRIDILRETPAAVRMLSLEPLLEDLGVVDLRGIHWAIVGGESGPNARPMHPDWARSLRDQCKAAGVPFFFKQWGAWVERTLDIDWPPHELYVHPKRGVLREIVEPKSEHEQGLREGTIVMSCVGKKAAGRLLDGKEHNEYPEASKAHA